MPGMRASEQGRWKGAMRVRAPLLLACDLDCVMLRSSTPDMLRRIAGGGARGSVLCRRRRRRRRETQISTPVAGERRRRCRKTVAESTRVDAGSVTFRRIFGATEAG
jgi:hypothetical protein